jgi:hypothetical protein
MSDEILRYTDLAALIQMAKARGWSNERIVRELSTGLPYAEALNLARRAAPLLNLTVSEFMRLRKNECSSGVFQLGDNALAVAVLAKFFGIDAAFLLQHVALQRPQQIVCGVIQQLGFSLGLFCSGNFHAFIFGRNDGTFN